MLLGAYFDGKKFVRDFKASSSGKSHILKI